MYSMLFLGTGAAWAQSTPPPHAPPPRQDPPAQDRDRNEGGLPDSVRRVERQTGGEVLRAEPMQRDGREVYRLKVLTSDGRVRVVQDDPDKPRERPQPERKGKKEQSSRDSDENPPQ
ncbi:MAG: hypothetical protein ABI588_01070 [Arenimonas sp.]